MKNNHEIILKQYAAYCKEQPLYLGTAGSYGMEMLTIIREGVWAEYDILAAFHPPVGAAVQVRVGANNQIGVPIEATAEKGMGEIVFAGYKEGVRQIAVDVLYKVAPSSGASGTEPAEPTPNVVQQIMLAANAAEKLAQSVRDDADAGKFNGVQGPKGDTAAIQAALDAASTRGISTVLLPAGTYRVSATAVDNNFFAALTVHSGQRILFDAATLQLTANGYDFYAVLNIHNVNNVTIEGGLTIIGDREAHTATTGESGHGIRIVNSHNVHVSDVDIRYTWGDGVCVGGNGTMDEISENVTLERIRTYKCSRNGLSIIEADGVVVRDCDFTYTDRTAPQYGIDVEPNLGTATNITIENVRMLNNGIGGFALYTTKATQNGVLTLRNIETDAKTIIYTSSAKGAPSTSAWTDGGILRNPGRPIPRCGCPARGTCGSGSCTSSTRAPTGSLSRWTLKICAWTA